LSGDDATCMHAMLAGADGVIGRIERRPDRCDLCDAARAGNIDAASRIDRALTALYRLTGVEPTIPVKWCLPSAGSGRPGPGCLC
jgi:dihydrodipicolinate synthase/N-acetylneuraminate lyase